ncbi:MAG: DMT family transporter [Gemmatimonadaceae bacterium]
MSRSEKHTARATTLIALSACGFGSISVLTTIVSRAGTPLVPAMFWRYLVAAVVIGAIVTWKERADFQLSMPLLMVGGFGQALITYLSLRALDFIPVGPLAFLFYTYPAWVAIISALRGTDRMTPMRAVALVAALAGVTVIVGSPFNSSLNPIGVALALVSAVAYGAYLPVISSLQVNVKPMIVAFHLILGATIVFGVAALVRGDIGDHVTVTAAAGILGLSLISTVLAFWLLLAGMAVLGPVGAAIISTIEPFFTTLLGAAVLAEHLTIRTGIGGMLIALAVIVIQRAAAAPQRDQITA